MKILLISLAILLSLSIVFSTINFPGESMTPKGSGTQHKGDSGLVIPGKGTDPVEVVVSKMEITTEATISETERVGDKNTPAAYKLEAAATKEEHNKVDGMIIAFWHGVAAVLVGGAGALVVAWAWMKIRGAEDGK